MPRPNLARLPICIVACAECYQITFGDEKAALYIYREGEPTRANVTNRLSTAEAKALAHEVARTLQKA